MDNIIPSDPISFIYKLWLENLTPLANYHRNRRAKLHVAVWKNSGIRKILSYCRCRIRR